jgi:hypothetical protein
MHFGQEAVSSALDACLAPFDRIRTLIRQDPEATDETVCARYQENERLPTLGVHVVKAYRAFLAADSSDQAEI